MLPLKMIEHGGLPVYVRATQYQHMDEWILKEVRREYWWNCLHEVQTAVDLGGHLGFWSLFLEKDHPSAPHLGFFLRARGDRLLVEIADTVTLEDVYAASGFENVDVLKIDIEGGEVQILQHCADETLDRTRVIVGEIHRRISEFEEVTKYRLQKHGFKVEYKPTNTPLRSIFYAERSR